MIKEKEADPPNSHNVSYWCPSGIDLNDENAVLNLWEGELGVGAYLDVLAYDNQTGWINQVVKDFLPNIGDAGVSGCGTVQGECNPASGIETCQTMVTNLGVGAGQA